MAGTAYGSFAVGDANIDNVMLQTAAVKVGHCALTLTEMTTYNVPKIAAGSKIEINGTLFHFDSTETISGSAVTGTNYIYITSAGVPTWTATAPTWFDSKQGWYDGTGAYRYIDFIVRYASGAFYKAFTRNKEGFNGLAFYVELSGNFSPSGNQVVPFSNIIYDTGGAFNTSTYTFNTLSSGLYQFTIAAYEASSVAGTAISLYVNGAAYNTDTGGNGWVLSVDGTGSSALTRGCFTCTLYLSAGVSVTTIASSGTLGKNGTFFSGRKVD